MSPKKPISTAAIFLSRAVETVRFFLAGYTLQRIKSSRSQTSGGPGEKIKNAANRRKTACSGAFGVPDTTRTCDPGLRRLVLYPTELLGHISKIFNFSAQTDSNELPLRRGLLYPFNYRGRYSGKRGKPPLPLPSPYFTSSPGRLSIHPRKNEKRTCFFPVLVVS